MALWTGRVGGRAVLGHSMSKRFAITAIEDSKKDEKDEKKRRIIAI